MYGAKEHGKLMWAAEINATVVAPSLSLFLCESACLSACLCVTGCMCPRVSVCVCVCAYVRLHVSSPEL